MPTAAEYADMVDEDGQALVSLLYGHSAALAGGQFDSNLACPAMRAADCARVIGALGVSGVTAASPVGAKRDAIYAFLNALDGDEKKAARADLEAAGIDVSGWELEEFGVDTVTDLTSLALAIQRRLITQPDVVELLSHLPAAFRHDLQPPPKPRTHTCSDRTPSRASRTRGPRLRRVRPSCVYAYVCTARRAAIERSIVMWRWLCSARPS